MSTTTETRTRSRNYIVLDCVSKYLWGKETRLGTPRKADGTPFGT